jgi:hypothetical protein
MIMKIARFGILACCIAFLTSLGLASANIISAELALWITGYVAGGLALSALAWITVQSQDHLHKV